MRGAGPDRWAGNQTVDICTPRTWLEHVHETKHALSICHVFQKFGINVSEKEKKWSTDLSTTNSNSLEGHRIN